MSRVTFNNKNSAFFNELRQKVDDYFTSNNIKPTGNYKLYWKSIILLSSAATLYTILVFFTPTQWWVALALCTVLGIVLAGIGFNVMHDGAHGSYSRKKWVNDVMALSLNLMGGNSYIWKNKHNLNHHSFTNIEGMDDDIDIKPWIRTHKNQPRYFYHRFQHIYWVLLYGVTYLLWVFVQDFRKYFSGKIADTKLRAMSTKDHVIFWVSKLLYIALFIVLPIIKLGLVEMILGYIVMSFVCGFIISVVFQLAHIVNDTTFPMPNEDSRKIDQEWAIHQLATTANFSTKSKIIGWFTGGLNFQVEHHLFPKISHVHYPKISEFVKETCEKFNVQYIEYPNLFSAIRSHVSYLRLAGTI